MTYMTMYTVRGGVVLVMMMGALVEVVQRNG